MKNAGNVPKLRFPEFRDAGEWTIDELSNVADFVGERIPLAQITLQNYISTENILPDYEGVTISSKLPSSGSITCFKTNDILVSNIRPYLRKVWFSNKNGGASNDVIVIRAKEAIRNKYLAFILRNDSFIEYVMEGARGVKMPRGDISLIKKYPLAYPSDSEQQKIAECLGSIDDRITLETQKLDALRVHKKGLMQQLFPAEGQTLPQLRFPEFRNAGEWNLTALGKVSTITSGGTPNRSNKTFWNGSIPWVTTSLIDFNTIYKADEFISESGLKGSSAKLFPKNTILMAMYGQGKTRGKVAILGIEATTNQACAAILLDKDFHTNFLFQNLVGRYDEIRELSNRGGQENLSAGLIEQIPISYPTDKDEQQKIANCLTSLDELITLQAQTIDALKLHKKGLMQQLFPSVNEVSE